MSFTALVVELLIVGIGAACWLALLIAAITGYSFSVFPPQAGTPLAVGATVGIVYVLGIVADRLVRRLFGATVERAAKRRVFTDARVQHVTTLAPYIDKDNLPMEIEKFVRAHSEALGKKIDYNRSRFRICRAWVLHFAFIALVFPIWASRSSVCGAGAIVTVTGILLGLFALTLCVAVLLATDHQKDLLESFEIVAMGERAKDRSGSEKVPRE